MTTMNDTEQCAYALNGYVSALNNLIQRGMTGNDKDQKPLELVDLEALFKPVADYSDVLTDQIEALAKETRHENKLIEQVCQPQE